MKTQSTLLHKTALAAAVTLVIGGVASLDVPTGAATGMSSFISSAYAGDGSSGGGQKGAMGENRGGQGGQGARGAGGQGYKGGRSVADVLADDDGDDDSDRPDWAGVPGGEGRPGGGGNPNPGDTKGDTYGDMIMLVRDPDTGEPITWDDPDTPVVEEWLQACTSADCSTSVPMVDNEVPAGYTTYEVDLGRASLVRAPSSVMDRRLEEALSLIASATEPLSQDEAGRIVVTVDGVEKTIDSPLENLALYIDLMEGLTSNGTSPTEAALTPDGLATLNTAASLLGGVADKTGDVNLDFVVNMNVIADINAVDPYDGFDYTRDYGTVTYFYTFDGVEVKQATLDVDEYLLAVNLALPTGEADAATFAAATDDAIEVIELIHTQIHDLSATGELLPGTL